MTTSITSLPSASVPLTGTERVPMDQAIGSTVSASALVVGTGYRIESLGTTNWTACGLPAGVTAAVGLTFVATAAGTGTGTAVEAQTVEATAAAIAALAPATDLAYDQATRLLSSSTGADVTLPLATASLPGLESAADKAKLDSITVDRATLTVAPARNNSGATIAKGVPVIVTGSSGNTKTIAPADASTEATAANTLGLTLDAIANNADGFVITEGPLSGVNTAGLTEGQLFYLSETTGGVTSTRPTQPAHGVVLGWCVKSGAGTAGILYVKIDNGVELDELHDVLITGPTAGQVLRRASDGPWKNASLVATDISDSSSTGRAVLTAADAAAARSAISAEQAGAAAAAQAAAVQRSNHTGTQLAATISDFSAAVTALGTTVGNALRSLVNPSAISFLRINADNSVTARSASEMRGDLGLTSAATATIGTAAGNLVALDGSARLPAVDGSLLTGLPSAPVTSVAGRTGAVTLAVGDVANAVATTDARLSDARTPLAHNQAWSTITGTPTTLAGYGITDAFNPASPGPIGGTTSAAGTFTALVATTRLGLPSGAPASPVARDLYQVADTLRYRDSGGAERLLLNGADNLANLGNTATARNNLGLGSAATATSSDFVSATATRAANLVLAGPISGAAAAPTFRALVAADLPAGVGGGTKTLARFTARDNQPPASNFATLNTRNSISVLEFDAATEESAVFVSVIPEGANLTSGLLVRIWWMGATATSGNVRWGASFEASGTDMDADSFDSVTQVTSAANGTSGIESIAEITCTAIDSLAAGNRFRLRIARIAADATNDTMTGDAQLVAVEVRGVA